MAWIRFCLFLDLPVPGLFSAFPLTSTGHPWKQLWWSDSTGLAHLEPAGVLTASLLLSLDSHHRRFKKIVQSLHFSHHGDPRILTRSWSTHYSLPCFRPLPGRFLYSNGKSLCSFLPLLTGIWLGFLYYELVHYRLHLSKADVAWLEYHAKGISIITRGSEQLLLASLRPYGTGIFGTYRRISAR